MFYDASSKGIPSKFFPVKWNDCVVGGHGNKISSITSDLWAPGYWQELLPFLIISKEENTQWFVF